MCLCPTFNRALSQKINPTIQHNVSLNDPGLIYQHHLKLSPRPATRSCLCALAHVLLVRDASLHFPPDQLLLFQDAPQASTSLQVFLAMRHVP